MLYDLGNPVQLVDGLYNRLVHTFWSKRWELARYQCDHLIESLALSIKDSLGEQIKTEIRGGHAT